MRLGTYSPSSAMPDPPSLPRRRMMPHASPALDEALTWLAGHAHENLGTEIALRAVAAGGAPAVAGAIARGPGGRGPGGRGPPPPVPQGRGWRRAPRSSTTHPPTSPRR